MPVPKAPGFAELLSHAQDPVSTTWTPRGLLSTQAARGDGIQRTLGGEECRACGP